MSIKIKVNEDGMWGDTDLSGIDVSASYAKFEQQVADAVADGYGYDTEVSVENVYNTKISGLDEYEDADEIESIRNTIESVWSDFEWVVDE